MRNDISVKMKIRFLLGRIRHSRARHKEIDSYIEKYIGGGTNVCGVTENYIKIPCKLK